MKHLSKILLFSSLLTVAFVSCKKDENKVFYEGGTAPVLTASQTTTIPLAYDNRDNEGIKLSWTNPNYQFNTGVSSQNVNYVIEIDKQGANFNSTNKQSVAISNDLTKTFTQGEFNDFLLNQLVLDTSRPANIQIRVVSTLSNGSVKMVSNVLNYTVVPYPIPPKVTPPSTDKLFITGSATPASWQCGCGEPELLSQKFNRITATLYELPSIQLTGGGSYLLLPKYGDWGAKYGYVGANNGNNVNGDDFKANGGDILAPPVTGLYKITVDFQRGKFTVTKL
jgi:hypothetical protein